MVNDFDEREINPCMPMSLQPSMTDVSERILSALSFPTARRNENRMLKSEKKLTRESIMRFQNRNCEPYL